MADLFAQRVETRENAIMRMKASACVAFIDATQKSLPRTSGNRWCHGFLDDVRGQLAGKYRATLTPRQVGHLLRYADHVGVTIEANGDRDHSTSKEEPYRWHEKQISRS